MMTIISFRFLVLSTLCLFLVTSRVAAEPSLFTFSLSPQANVLYQTTAQVDDYIIALDKYKKSNNRWMPERLRREQGQLTRYTIEHPKSYREEDIFNFYRDQIPQVAELLFACESRACGESNNWANDHFGIKQLYGTNTSQSYAVFILQANTYITIYTVRRGNRRLYTQLEVLLTHNQSS